MSASTSRMVAASLVWEAASTALRMSVGSPPEFAANERRSSQASRGRPTSSQASASFTPTRGSLATWAWTAFAAASTAAALLVPPAASSSRLASPTEPTGSGASTA